MRQNIDIKITFFLALILTVAMLWPLYQLPPIPNNSDKLIHFTAFLALSFPLAQSGRFGVLPVFIGASAYGGLIELVQPSFNRQADVEDFIADIIGVAVGISSGLVYRSLRNR